MKTDRVVELVVSTVKEYTEDAASGQAAKASAQQSLPPDQIKNIDTILATESLSYRQALVIQLAYGLCAEEPIDIRERQVGARGQSGVAGRVAAFLAEHHIPTVRDAYQNIGKNTAKLVRGNSPAFDQFLTWAAESARARADLEHAFRYACAGLAATSRPIKQMPELNVGNLTFARVMRLVEDLFAAGSQGAYEQFTIAALLHALVEQVGVAGYRVETKSLNASDHSSRAAGDIQILIGNRVVEAYEVTANDWTTKVGAAEQTVREHDLSRLHIVAGSASYKAGDVLDVLQKLRADVSVLDVRTFAASIVSSLTKQYRAAAARRIYEFLDRYQPDIAKVNRFVDALQEHGLTL